MSTKTPRHSFFEELKRRGVIRVALAYASFAWILLQVADVLFPALGLPDWIIRVVAIACLLGFPIAIALAWAYKVTAEGVQREDAEGAPEALPAVGRSLNAVIIALLTIAVSWFAVDKFMAREHGSATPTIAVLPMVNTSGDEDQEYFSDGLTEELLHLLSRVEGLRVIGRTSSFIFKDRTRGLREIGEQLGADYLLEGSVRRAGDRVRIVASLIDASDGVELWTQTFNERFDDLFVVQNAIARGVVVELEIEFMNLSAAPANPQAYDLYLRALKRSYSGGRADRLQGIDYLQQALALDPELAVGWVLLARLVMSTVTLGISATGEGMEKVERALERALQIDEALADAHVAHGNYLMTFRWDWDGADAALRRALQLEPDNPDALRSTASLLAINGRLNEAIELVRQSRRIDPLSLATLHNIAFFQYLKRDYAAAEQSLRENIRIVGHAYSAGRGVLALILIERGKYEEAFVELSAETAEPLRLAGLSLVSYRMGNYEKAALYQRQLVERFGDRLAVPIAGNFAQRGNLDAAFEWFERAYEQRDPQLLWTKTHPANDPLRGDPRFNRLLERLGLEPG